MDYTAAQHLEEGIRLVVREETADMRSDIAEMQVDVADLRTDVNRLQQEQRRQGVLLENVESKLDTVLEMLSDALGIKKVVDKHEARLGKLEAGQYLFTATVKDHSQRLKAA